MRAYAVRKKGYFVIYHSRECAALVAEQHQATLTPCQEVNDVNDILLCKIIGKLGEKWYVKEEK